ncbi:MAG: hypothetical protein M3362_00535 [Acidobacteriota bacterium]|nr:hypothetical protein [Acidobacteriota bacterium]
MKRWVATTVLVIIGAATAVAQTRTFIDRAGSEKATPLFSKSAPATATTTAAASFQCTQQDWVAAANEIARNPAARRRGVVYVVDNGILPAAGLDENRWFAGDIDVIGGTITNLHGTLVASTIGWKPCSVAGSAGNLLIASGRYMDNSGSGLVSNEIKVLDAIGAKQDDAVKNGGVPIIEVVIASGGQTPSPDERDAILRLRQRGIAVLAAVGKLADPAACNGYPECYPGVVPVGVKDNANLGWGAFVASSSVPGVDPSDPEHPFSFAGSSSTVGQVAGSVWLAWSLKPNLTPDDAVHCAGFAAFSTPVAGVTYGVNAPALVATPQAYLVGQQDLPTQAAALDAITSLAGPFTATTSYFFGPPVERRIAVFAYNVPATETNVVVTATNGTSTWTLFPERLDPAPGSPFLTQLILKLPSSATGTLNLSLTLQSGMTTLSPLSVVLI